MEASPPSHAETLPKEANATAAADDRYITMTPGVRGGKPRISGRRITVADVAAWYLQQNRSVDEIVEDYALTHAQVHAALAYYYDHRAEIEEREAQDIAAAEALREKYPSKLPGKQIARD